MERASAEIRHGDSFEHQGVSALNCDLKLAWIGTPLNLFHYPSDKRRIATTTKEMQKAERNLDNFWEMVDDDVLHYTKQTLGVLLEPVVGHRTLERTVDWTEPKPKVKTKQPNHGQDSQGTIAFDLEKRTQETLVIEKLPQPRTKVKTRGKALDEPTSPPSDDIPPHAEQTQKYSVNKRVYKVAAALFRLPTEESVPGEVLWTDFLRAMASVEFRIERLNGSA